MFYTTLFTVCKNEERFLEEFLRYYLAIGVERILFVDNNTNENQKKIVDTISSQKIEYIKDNTELCGKNRLNQKYMHKIYKKSCWTLFFDRDEFLNLGSFSNIKNMLEKYHSKDLLFLNWKSYASKRPVDEKILINLKNRLKVNNKGTISDHVKSIVNTEKNSPLFTNPHCPDNIQECYNLTIQSETHRSAKTQLINDDFYINPHLCHYHYHGLENFILKINKPDRKLRMIDKLLKENKNYENLFETAYQQNYGPTQEMIEDDTMKKFIEKEDLYDKIYPK